MAYGNHSTLPFPTKVTKVGKCPTQHVRCEILRVRYYRCLTCRTNKSPPDSLLKMKSKGLNNGRLLLILREARHIQKAFHIKIKIQGGGILMKAEGGMRTNHSITSVKRSQDSYLSLLRGENQTS